MNFKDYLQQQGVEENALPETIATHKEAYQKLQQKAKRERHRTKYKRLELLITPQEYQTIQDQAKRHQQPMAVFAKASVFGYLEQLYIVPDGATIQTLETGIRQIGNNINQLVMRCHTSKTVDVTAVQALKDQLNGLDRLLQDKLRNPSNLNYLVEEALKAHPSYQAILQRLLTRYS